MMVFCSLEISIEKEKRKPLSCFFHVYSYKNDDFFSLSPQKKRSQKREFTSQICAAKMQRCKDAKMQRGKEAKSLGEVIEWFMMHAWKACTRLCVRGSNPLLSSFLKSTPLLFRRTLHTSGFLTIPFEFDCIPAGYSKTREKGEFSTNANSCLARMPIRAGKQFCIAFPFFCYTLFTRF